MLADMYRTRTGRVGQLLTQPWRWASTLLVCSVRAAPQFTEGTVYYSAEGNNYSVVTGVIDCDGGVACGYFNDSVNQTGWGVLEVKVDAKTAAGKAVTDEVRMYAAGYLEGYITATEMYYSWLAGWSNYAKYFGDGKKEEVIDWLDSQTQWINSQVAADKQKSSRHEHDSNDKLKANANYWPYMNLVMWQLNGTYDGYNDAAKAIGLPALSTFDINFMSSNQDMLDVLTKLDPNGTTSARWDSLQTKEEKMAERKRRTRCSAMVKVSPVLDDVMIAHSTWEEYFWMNRVYKQYLFYLQLATKGEEMSMSSYPGAMGSIDDFYLMNSGLVVTETTNIIYDEELFQQLVPQSLFSWQRVRVSNALCTSAHQWVQMFGLYNSGTYNNQWIVLDYGKFEKNAPLNKNILWIAEQLPGSVSVMNATPMLERGYWASYNVPAIESVYEESGNSAFAVANCPQTCSYDLAPRARIFRRDANSCMNISDVGRLMRYNNFMVDPIEKDDAAWAVMSRYDLNLTKKDAFGGTDTKMANLEMMLKQQVAAQSGPTHDDLAVFEWTEEFDYYNHVGCPLAYDFGWQLMQPTLSV